MCNQLHKDSESIATVGKGWKLFRVQDRQLLTLLGGSGNIYTTTQNEQGNQEVIWNILDSPGYIRGFCFFLTKEEAQKALGIWINAMDTSPEHIYKILEIEYSEGLGQHDERHFDGSNVIHMALCKRFSIIQSRLYPFLNL